MQDAVNFPLWVAIPQCIANTASIPGTISNGIDRMNVKLSENNIYPKFYFYGGHSLGGAMIPDYVASTVNDTANGVILMGAFLTRKYKTGKTAEGRPQVEFPTPTLTIGAELDGLTRVTRIMEAMYTQVTFSEDPDRAAQILPVTVIEGMNHMQFASGEPTAHVKNKDIQPENTEEVSHTLTARDAATFMSSIVYPKQDEYMSLLKSRVKESTDFLQPITDAFLMEGYQNFLPGCYCEALVRGFTGMDSLIYFQVLALTLLAFLALFSPPHSLK